MAGVIHSDYVTINSQQYPLADGKVKRSRIFSEQGFQVQKDANQPDFGDLNPALKAHEMFDFSRGFGLYVDHGKTYSGAIYTGNINHTEPGRVTMRPARAFFTAVGATVCNQLVLFNGATYALTDIGLYLLSPSGGTLTAVAGTPAQNLSSGVVHRGRLYFCNTTTNQVEYYTGAAFAVPANTVSARKLAVLDDRLFATRPLTNREIQVFYTGDEGATAWVTALTLPAGGTAAVPSPANLETSAFIAAPISNVSSRLFLSTPTHVWELDYTTGASRVLYDMTTNYTVYNGYALHFWPSTGKLYFNAKNTVVEVDLETREARSIGPEYAVYQSGVLVGFPDTQRTKATLRLKAEGISAISSDGNHLYVGTAGFTGNRPQFFIYTIGVGWSIGWMPTGTARITTLLSVYDTKPYLLVGTTSGGSLVWSWDLGGVLFEEEGSQAGGEYTNTFETPWLTLGLPSLQKVAYSLQLEATKMTLTGANLEVLYVTDYNETSEPTSLGSITSATARPYILDFLSQAGLAFTAIKLFFELSVTPTASDTPNFLGATLLWRPAPPVRYMYDMNLLIDPELERNGVYTDLDSALDSALEGTTTLSFDPRGDRDATMVRCVPIVDEAAVNSEQERDTDVYHLQLVQVY